MILNCYTFRLLVSAYIQKQAGYFVNFIDEGKTINQFCETVS